jgi:hypothetical protein
MKSFSVAPTPGRPQLLLPPVPPAVIQAKMRIGAPGVGRAPAAPPAFRPPAPPLPMRAGMPAFSSPPPARPRPPGIVQPKLASPLPPIAMRGRLPPGAHGLHVGVHGLIQRAAQYAPLNDDAYVVRGGMCLAANFSNGSGVVADANGRLSGVSTRSANDKSLAQLVIAGNIQNNKIGVTTAKNIRDANGTIVADGPHYHATVSGLTAQELEALFAQKYKNPLVEKKKQNPKPSGGNPGPNKTTTVL